MPRNPDKTNISSTSTFPQCDYRLIDRHIQSNDLSDLLASKASQFGGCRTKKFEQQSFNIKTGMGSWFKDPALTPDHQVWGGACHALSITWITEHAHGRSIWPWLQCSCGDILSGPASYILALQASSKGVSEPYFNYFTYYGSSKSHWQKMIFNFYGMTPYPLIGQYDYEASITFQNNPIKQNLDHLLSEIFNTTDHYILLRFYNVQQHGHCISMWSGKDIVLFDPEIGEFWFPSKDGFTEWFYEYWKKACLTHFVLPTFYISKWTCSYK
ncbi:YopT-type cysteine protease domain-containing protein [Pelagibaculum spongiae]|uniref:Peptidase C58 YopT-type domain-containing protein n=1 Tax=Pelagibaculum spongiae TaxID=2080658 RepID=A0A2V1H3J1_9GAMM|nr:YopT-type cysteine protease domain-containing protein [Pelagibaculum spongiae]PVZ71747.1 hypothetical protein DC094_01595 [Pelagibaculum spongiae]